jgi:hypothetical protein
MKRASLMRALPVLAMLALLQTVAAPLRAQGVPASIKYGKWALLAGAIGMEIVANEAHRDARSTFQQIEVACLNDHTFCRLGEDGRYLASEAEALFQETLQHDSKARRWMVGGEVAFLGAAAMFIYELAQPKGLPGNKPFEPEIRTVNGVTRFGVNVAF